MVIVLLLVLWFSVSPDTMLLLYAITLRDILLVRMKRFSSSSILFILEFTLITISCSGARRLKAKPTIAGRVRTR